MNSRVASEKIMTSLPRLSFSSDQRERITVASSEPKSEEPRFDLPSISCFWWDSLSALIAMVSDEQRRQVHLDLVELKNLQTIVLDLEELKQLHFIANRPRIRSILSREISNLEAKIVSSCTYSDEKAQEKDSGEIKLAEMGSKRKHKEIYELQSSKMKKKTKLININEPHVMNGSSCKSTKEERNQQSLQTRNSEQVLWETANLSDVNEAFPMTVVATENADFSNKTSQTTPLPGAAAFSGYRLGSPGKMSWCRRCQLPTHPESECLRCNGTRFTCQVAGHFITNCPKEPRDGISSSRARTVTAGSSCQSMQEEPNQLSLPTRTSEQVLRENSNQSHVNEAFPMTVVAAENADFSNKTSQTTPLPGAAAASRSRLGSPEKRSWCRTRRLPHAESECSRRNGTCFRCHEAGHFVANCPKAPRDGISSSGARTVTAGGSCQCTQDEPNQQSLPAGTSEQVLWDKANPSVVNEASLTTVVATESAVVSNKTSQTTTSPATTAASGSRLGRSRRRPWCRTCRLPNAESECSRRNGTCWRCHEAGHFVANCPKAPRDGISFSGARTVTAGGSCQCTQDELNQQSFPTGTSEQVLWKNANPSVVNEASLTTVVATESADISNKTSQTMQIPGASSSWVSRLVSPGKRSWCRTCRLPHAESECSRRNDTCLRCHEAGHFVANCPKMPQNSINSSGARTVTPGSRCESMQEELHQQSFPTRTSDQVLPEKANSSDVNETSTVAVVATENSDVSNKTSQTTPSPATTAASGSRLGRSRRRPWCRTCRLPHAESECSRRDGPCVNCHEAGHFVANCPKAPRDGISFSGARTVTPGSRCESMQEELHQQSFLTRTSEQVLPEKANSSDVNETSTVAVVATENADVSNKTSQTTPSPATTAASGSRLGRSRRRPWCCTCQLPYAESECSRRDGPCVNCHEAGHFVANCPKAPRDGINSSGVRTVTAGSRCESMEEELHQQSFLTRTSEQVLPEKANSSDANETSTVAVVATENADVSNKTSQTTPSPATTAASGSRLGRSRRRPRRHTRQLLHAESECSRRNGPCVNCHEIGHFMENCPKLPRYVISPSGTRTVTAGSRCESLQEELHQLFLPTRTSEQFLPEKANSSNVNETSTMAVVATEIAGVSNKTIQTMSGRGPVEGKTSQQKTQTTISKGVGPSSSAIVAASKSRLKLSRKRSWCHACRSLHANSERLRCKHACFKCRRMGHFAEECPWPPQNAINPSGTTIIAVGGNTVLHALLYEEPWVETDSICARKMS